MVVGSVVKQRIDDMNLEVETAERYHGKSSRPSSKCDVHLQYLNVEKSVITELFVVTAND